MAIAGAGHATVAEATAAGATAGSAAANTAVTTHNTALAAHGGETMHVTDDELDAAIASTSAGSSAAAIAAETTARTNADDAIRGEFAAADNALREEMSAGVAMAMAMQAPPVTPGKKMNLTIGAGFYNSETAVAISAGARVNEHWTISGSIGYVAYGDDESDAGGRVAATFEF